MTVKSVLSDFSPTLPTRRRPAHVQIEKYNDEMWWQLVSLIKLLFGIIPDMSGLYEAISVTLFPAQQ